MTSAGDLSEDSIFLHDSVICGIDYIFPYIIYVCGHHQLLSQRSKMRTSVADPESASGGTSSACNLSIFSYLSYLGHPSFLGLQTKTRRQSNSSTFCSFQSHNPETFMSSTATAFVHATHKRFCAMCYSQALTKSASRKKWYVLVPLDGFPWFKHHSIALVLLYNIRLEQSFSIERFPSYTLLNI